MNVKFCFTCRESMVLIHAVPIEAPSSRVRLKRAVPPGRCAGGSEATPSTVSGMKPNPVADGADEERESHLGRGHFRGQMRD